jgi:hypothetical protein
MRNNVIKFDLVIWNIPLANTARLPITSHYFEHDVSWNSSFVSVKGSAEKNTGQMWPKTEQLRSSVRYWFIHSHRPGSRDRMASIALLISSNVFNDPLRTSAIQLS